jgi:branched-subunit amino acid transport protein
MSLVLTVLVLAAGSYLLRSAGPVLGDRVRLPGVVEDLLGDATVVLLVALTAVSAIYAGSEFAGWARPAGVLVGGVLAVARAPFPVVVVAAAVVTAVLRAVGVD